MYRCEAIGGEQQSLQSTKATHTGTPPRRQYAQPFCPMNYRWASRSSTRAIGRSG
jgi:hypothetical protein